MEKAVDFPILPRCIETVYRLGYRGIGTLVTADESSASTLVFPWPPPAALYQQ
jgi:hypothetical protein